MANKQNGDISNHEIRRFAELIHSMTDEQKSGLLLIMEGAKIIADKQKSGTKTANRFQAPREPTVRETP